MTNQEQLDLMLGKREAPPTSVARSVLIRTDLADQYTTVPGPLGVLHVGFTSLGISSLVPTAVEDEFLHAHAARVGRPAFPGELPDRLAGQLQKTLESGRLRKLPVDLRVLTPFQQRVLEITATIPPGEVRPYGWVAREMASSGAVRAVGSALARNPIAIAIPCHRVVRSDGTIGNYAFGTGMKRSLLEHEGMTEFGKLRYVGSDTTGVFCFPTCRHARRIGSDHRIEFRDIGHATDIGYRPCRVCRPA